MIKPTYSELEECFYSVTMALQQYANFPIKVIRIRIHAIRNIPMCKHEHSTYDDCNNLDTKEF